MGTESIKLCYILLPLIYETFSLLLGKPGGLLWHYTAKSACSLVKTINFSRFFKTFIHASQERLSYNAIEWSDFY